MLLQRTSLASVAPSGEKYLISMLLKVYRGTYFTCQKLSKLSKSCFTTTKETVLAGLIWPTRYTVSTIYTKQLKDDVIIKINEVTYKLTQIKPPT